MTDTGSNAGPHERLDLNDIATRLIAQAKSLNAGAVTMIPKNDADQPIAVMAAFETDPEQAEELLNIAQEHSAEIAWQDGFTVVSYAFVNAGKHPDLWIKAGALTRELEAWSDKHGYGS